MGSYGYQEAQAWGLTGVMARCTGIKKDVRLNKNTTYGNYYFLSPVSFIGRNGDSYDRYLIRMAEMVESSSLIYKCLANLPFATPNLNTKFFKHQNL